MPALPVIRGASAALYPFRMTISFLTGVGAWQNGAQQRWIRRSAGLVRFDIPYGGLSLAQRNTVKAAISSAKGRFDNTLTLTLGSTTYTNLGIDNDEWAATESDSMLYDGPLRLMQSVGQNLSPGTPGTNFPTLANGAICILRYRQKKRYQTVAQRVESGANYTYAEFAGGLSGYPTDGLMAWDLEESSMSDADLATRIQHFIDNWGRAFSFTFTDEDAVAYPKTHYAMDDLVIDYRGPNDSSVKIGLEATN
jgi:hypothetical protein